MKTYSLKLTIFALGLLAAVGAFVSYVQAATYVHTFTNQTDLVYTNSVDTHTMNPTCDGGSPLSYTWSLSVNGKYISGTHTCPPPGPGPTGLTVSPQICGTGQNYLDWDDVPGAASYSIYIYDVGWVGNSIGSNYMHTGTVSSSYKYYVRSNDAMGVQSGNSDFVTMVTADACVTPSITLTATPDAGDAGETSVLEWIVSDADECTASGGWSGSKSTTGGTESVSPAITTTYNLSCNGEGNTNTSASVTITRPSGFISASACLIPDGGSGCFSSVNWGAYNFIGTPEVFQGEGPFSVNATGPELRTVTPEDNTFRIIDNEGAFSAEVTADVTCGPDSGWVSDIGQCAALPIVSIDAGVNLIRSGATLEFEISVQSNFDLTCTIRDGGAPTEFGHTAAAGVQVYTQTTRPLRSAQIVDVTCTSSLYPALNITDQLRVEVIPTVQEL